ncbi:USP6 N-terminal-like protein [Nowakowskiella sp. JEL0078]|nr:USP6 N-terminal-like protein [Nowakowskiella sp. JEL0078]
MNRRLIHPKQRISEYYSCGACKSPCVCTLRLAISNNDLELVKALKIGANDINHIHSDGLSALHASCNIGNVAITKYLLERGANLDLIARLSSSKQFKFSCLFFAFKHSIETTKQMLKLLLEFGLQTNSECIFCTYFKDPEKIRLLLDFGWSIDLHLLHDDRPLLIWGFLKYYSDLCFPRDTFDLLCEKSVDFNTQDKRGMSILHHGIHRFDMNLVKTYKFLHSIIDNRVVNVNLPDFDGKTPLDYALNMTKLHSNFLLWIRIIRAGARIPDTPVFVHDFLQRTFKLSHDCAAEESLEMLQILIQTYPNILNSTAYSRFGRTLLHMAIRAFIPRYQISLKIISFLVKSGASIEILDSDKRSPMDYATSVKIWKVVAESISENSLKRFVVLCFQSRFMRVEIIQTLFQRSPIIIKSSVDELGRTPLHLAAKMKSCKVVAELLKLGVDVNAQDLHRKTPIEYSRKTKNIEFLIKSGARHISKLNAKELMYIGAKSSVDIIKFVCNFYPSLVNMDCGLVDSKKANITPIFIASATQEGDSLAIVMSLIQLGANVNLKICNDSHSAYEKSPLDYAIAARNLKLVMFFAQNYPKFANDWKGRSPLESLVDLLDPNLKRINYTGLFHVAFCALISVTDNLVISLKMFRRVLQNTIIVISEKDHL